MNDNAKSAKMSLIISIFSVVICLVAVTLSGTHLRYVIASDFAAGSAVTLFCCTIAILCANVTIFISCYNKYKKSSK
jgi:hypothetical protein